MKIGIVVTPQKIIAGVLYLMMASAPLGQLFRFIPKGAKEMFNSSFANSLREQNEKEWGFNDLCFTYSVDQYSNVVIVCPPIVDEKTGEVFLEREQYEGAIRDRAWPTYTIDLDDVQAIMGVNPSCHAKILANSAADTESKTTADMP